MSRRLTVARFRWDSTRARYYKQESPSPKIESDERSQKERRIEDWKGGCQEHTTRNKSASRLRAELLDHLARAPSFSSLLLFGGRLAFFKQRVCLTFLDSFDCLRPFMVAVFAFIGYIKGSPFYRNLFMSNFDGNCLCPRKRFCVNTTS